VLQAGAPKCNSLQQRQIVREGSELPPNSAGKTTIIPKSAAHSGANLPDSTVNDAGLEIVIGAWPLLDPHARSIIVGIARKAV
jgi:hypothetical protein